MFERFTPEARDAIVLTQEHARRLKHDYIGSEHLLLGLAGMAGSASSRVLRTFDLNPDRLHDRVVAEFGIGQTADIGQIRFTEELTGALNLALADVLNREERVITPEHLLIAAIRDPAAPAARVIASLDVSVNEVRSRLEATLEPD